LRTWRFHRSNTNAVHSRCLILDPASGAPFDELLIGQLPLVNRHVKALALLAPGVANPRTFSFAGALVPFAMSESRGRHNNFIIDSVDNEESLFGGPVAQFTNADLCSEFRIYTSVFKAEYARNSGGVVNILAGRRARKTVRSC
jgi:hypothetical protein